MSNTGQTSNDVQSFKFDALGVIESPYQEKFAIPRQPNLVSAAKGKVILTGLANNMSSLEVLNSSVIFG